NCSTAPSPDLNFEIVVKPV
ncbi:unnamed protein product, partial [Allacma fusca]